MVLLAMASFEQVDVAVVGAGLAGLVTTLELLDAGLRVHLVDKDSAENLGGLAKEAFGGIHLVDTPTQRRQGLRDSPELAFADWLRAACFGPDDEWPRRWARLYCERSVPLIDEYLRAAGVRYLPIVNWAERGLFEPLNSLPRWHIVWGTGHEIIARLAARLEAHPRRALLRTAFEHDVKELTFDEQGASGVRGQSLKDGRDFELRAPRVVLAAGGFGGALDKVREHWPKDWGSAPPRLLNGAHRHGDGRLLFEARKAGAAVTHLDWQWNYPAGVAHPEARKKDDGLSLLAPRSGLWLDARGARLGPPPLVWGTDTRYLVEQVARAPGQYSWLVLNEKIARRELAVSGCDYMTAFRYQRRLELARNLLFGDRALVERLVRECPDDIVSAGDLDELAQKMDERSLFGQRVDKGALVETVRSWDAMVARGVAFHNDPQLRLLAAARAYRGDRLRLCRPTRIDDPRARPLLAIRQFILVRKSMGGLVTDLSCRVLTREGKPVRGLFAVGEQAGFGGGALNGQRSLEGTFLGGCVLTGRLAAQAIARGD